MLVAFVIISALSSFAAPKFFVVSDYQKRAFFDDTLNALRYSQKLAISTDCNVLFKISVNKFVIKRPSATDRSLCSSITSADFTMDVARPGSDAASYDGNASSYSSSLVDATIFFTSKNTVSGDSQVIVNGRTIVIAMSTGFVYAP